MTTLPCMFLSLVLLVPEKNVFRRNSTPRHDATFKAGHRYGMASTPLKRALPTK